jgi:hypothetical protein
MKLLLRTWSSVDDYNADITSAFVDISKEMAQTILKRAKMFKELQAQDEDLVEMCFWVGSKGPSFLTTSKLILRGFTEPEREELDEEGCLTAEKFPHIEDIDPEKDGSSDMDLIRMLITDDYVIWEADVKYANVTISTEGLSLAEIEKML